MNLTYTDIITNRDLEAFNNLKNNLQELNNDFIEEYFQDVSTSSINNPKESLENDHKIVNLNSKSFSISQLEIWDQKDFIKENQKTILDLINS
jgi:hypothetical protein